MSTPESATETALAKTGTRSMFRYEVGIGHAWTHPLTGDPVHVANGVTPLVVEFWAEYDDQAEVKARTFQVFGTGHPLPPGARYVGTCPRVSGLIWHLYELVSDETARSDR